MGFTAEAQMPQQAGLMPEIRLPVPPDPFGGIPGYSSAQAPRPTLAEQPRYLVKVQGVTPEVERLLALPEDEIDLGTAALTISKAILPALNTDEYELALNRLADAAKGYAGESSNSDVLARAVIKAIYGDAGYHYDFAPNARKNDDNFLLHRVLDRKVGQCYGLSLLFLAVAQRVGLRAYSVAAPNHVFVRIMGEGVTVRNFDPSSASWQTDAYYIQHFKIADKGVQSGAYLRTESRREFLAYVLQQNSLLLRRYGDLSDATRLVTVAWLERAAAINPQAVGIVETLRWAYDYERMEASRLRKMQLADSYNDKAMTAFKRTEELGYQEGAGE